MDFRKYFRLMKEKGASDMYLRTMALPRVRVDGKVEVLLEKEISGPEMNSIVDHLLPDDIRKQEFYDNNDIDFIFTDPDAGRFRINIFLQRGTPALVARHVNSSFNTFSELNLPEALLKTFCEETKGLFLVCGPAGNGKSTTIATMLEYVNQTSAQHIITIEDPIEFLFTDCKSIISQRELGIDVPTYPAALKHVTQQSPDIIFIGNVRDEDTMRAAINAAELGTFVMTTFHTVNAVQTIVRMINFFPPYLHEEVRAQISIILRGTVSLRLLQRKDGQGRIPAFETMVVTPTISRLIAEGKIREIQNFIDEGDLYGMQSFEKSLVNLVKSGLVDETEARRFADSKDDFNLALQGIKKTTD